MWVCNFKARKSRKARFLSTLYSLTIIFWFGLIFVGDGGYLTSLVLLALSKPTVLNNFLHGENFPFPRPPFAFDISKNRRTSFTEVLLFCGRWRCRTSDLSDVDRTLYR